MKFVQESGRDGVTTVLAFSPDERDVLLRAARIAGFAWELAEQYEGNGVSLRAINLFARLQADASLAADGIEVDWKRHPEVKDA